MNTSPSSLPGSANPQGGSAFCLPPSSGHVFEPGALEQCCQLIATHRGNSTTNEAIACLDTLKRNHDSYVDLKVDPFRLCGLAAILNPGQSTRANRAPTGATILSSHEHFDAQAVVVRCMDNRCSAPNVELNLAPHEVCEVVSAGHVLDMKDLESIAVGVVLKHAKVVLVEAHGGICGAVKLALTEKRLAHGVEHDTTAEISRSLGDLGAADVPNIFAGTLENLNLAIGKILDPDLNLEMLSGLAEKPSFLSLVEVGKIIILGVFVDFELLTSPSGEKSLIKRLTFFDTKETIARFISEKLAAYSRR